MVELGFPQETSYRDRENLIGDLSTTGDGVLAMVNVEDIICNTHHE